MRRKRLYFTCHSLAGRPFQGNTEPKTGLEANSEKLILKPKHRVYWSLGKSKHTVSSLKTVFCIDFYSIQLVFK